MQNLEDLKKAGEAAEWLQLEGLKTLENGYLLPGETPRQMYVRVAKSAAGYLPEDIRAEYEKKFFDIIWNNWLCLATPIASNMGTKKGLPISCFGSAVKDDLFGIFETNTEIAMLSKFGGGTSSFMGNVRGRGAEISNGGRSAGTSGWTKVFKTTVEVVKQASAGRRGQHAVNLPIEHPDVEEFIDLRKHQDGIHLAVCISNEFIERCKSGDEQARKLRAKVLKARMETGEPYMIFVDKINAQNPQCYTDRGLTVKSSNLCSEIALHCDEDHTFVCCLSSMNAYRWDEWKDTDAVFTATVFLDCVMEEFVQKAESIPGFEKAVRFAKKSRALGLGVLGYHSYLQDNMIPFNSLQARVFNAALFKHIAENSHAASKWMAELLGEPEWCAGSGFRNTHTTAVAPTTSNAIISGSLSQGIEPIAAATWTQKTAKGTFIRKNIHFSDFLDRIGMNKPEVWESVSANSGSVAHLEFLTQEQKEVFKSAYEIDQKEIVFQANQRQKWIDQAQSLNLFFSSDEDPQYIHEVHWMAETSQYIKTLYYVRSESSLKAERQDECLSCQA
jgi:ribonucleoside-diphosphate reductase alpha chain